MSTLEIPPKSEPGQKGSWWSPMKNTQGQDIAWMQCTNGHVAILDVHEIADDGTVTPSVVCPTMNCDFHEHIRLTDWKA